MSQYSFNGIELPEVTGVPQPIPIRIGKANTPMRIGGYSGSKFYDARQMTVSGVWLAAPGQNFSDMELAYASFASSIARADMSRLFVRYNWYYNAIVEAINEGERGVGGIEYDIDFYLADPRMYKVGPNTDGSSDVVNSVTLSYGTVFTVTSGVETPVTLKLAYSSTFPATSINITPIYNNSEYGDTLVWTPTANGQVIVNLEKQTAQRAGVDVMNEFDGAFFDVQVNKSMTLNFYPPLLGLLSASIEYREARL